MDLLLHPATKNAIKAYLAKPSHAVIIEGKVGVGKKTVATYLSVMVLQIDQKQYESHPHLLTIEAKNSSISINDIRQAQQFLKLKTTGRDDIRRVLVIEKAELMTVEAQNAFLKILEEPPKDTVILILTSQKIKLLSTIRSRTQSLLVSSPSKDALNSYFIKLGYPQTSVDQAQHVSNARIGLMSSILKGENTDLISSINLAKKILAMPKFKRLATADELSKDKDSLPGVIDGLMIVCQAALKQTLKKNSLAQSKKWHSALSLTTEVAQLLPTNPNLKLLMTNLFLNL